MEFVCSDFPPCLAGTRFEGARVVTAPRALAAVIAKLALSAVLCDPASLDANYVRRSDAELFWREFESLLSAPESTDVE